MDKGRDAMINDWLGENIEIRRFLQASGAESSTAFYDELASSPLPCLDQLCSEIGCSFNPSALRYWERSHHAFAANGASSPVLRSLPHISQLPNFATGDDPFYEANYRRSFVDCRWKEQLTQTDAGVIQGDPRIADFLALYGRVLTPSRVEQLRG
jgi:hypothetical protein